MLNFSKEQKGRIEKAVESRVSKQTAIQLAIGFAGFTLAGAAIGFFTNSVIPGAAVGFAGHALLMILSNDAIEFTIKKQVNAYLESFYAQLRNAPDIVKKHYMENLKHFTDKQMSKWAQKDFAVRLQAIDIIELLND